MREWGETAGLNTISDNIKGKGRIFKITYLLVKQRTFSHNSSPDTQYSRLHFTQRLRTSFVRLQSAYRVNDKTRIQAVNNWNVLTDWHDFLFELCLIKQLDVDFWRLWNRWWTETESFSVQTLSVYTFILERLNNLYAHRYIHSFFRMHMNLISSKIKSGTW